MSTFKNNKNIVHILNVWTRIENKYSSTKIFSAGYHNLLLWINTSESSTGLCISFCIVDWAPTVRCHLELERFEGNLEMDLTVVSDLHDLKKKMNFMVQIVFIFLKKNFFN